MSDVVVSFGRDDRGRAAKLVALLEANGYECWWRGALPDGPISEGDVRKAVQQGRVCLVLWSGSASQSDWVAKEISWAPYGSLRVALLSSTVQEPPPGDDAKPVQMYGWDGNDPKHDGVVRLLQAVAGWQKQLSPQGDGDHSSAILIGMVLVGIVLGGLVLMGA